MKLFDNLFTYKKTEKVETVYEPEHRKPLKPVNINEIHVVNRFELGTPDYVSGIRFNVDGKLVTVMFSVAMISGIVGRWIYDSVCDDIVQRYVVTVNVAGLRERCGYPYVLVFDKNKQAHLEANAPYGDSEYYHFVFDDNCSKQIWDLFTTNFEQLIDKYNNRRK